MHQKTMDSKLDWWMNRGEGRDGTLVWMKDEHRAIDA
jgi:hypothetical protein